MADPFSTSTYETTLFVRPEVFVYRLPPRVTNKGHKAAEWDLTNPMWSGRIRVTAKGPTATIRLEDKNNGDLFAQSPIEDWPSAAIEQVLDSSRYFVLRITDPRSGRNAFIGAGFQERSDSFDFNVALQDHFKWVHKVKDEAAHPVQQDTGPHVDYSLKAGQTITVSIGKKGADGEKRERPKPSAAAGGITPLLAPPPSASRRVNAPTAQASAPQTQGMFGAPPQQQQRSTSGLDDLVLF
eukprot:Colp12_sorted_trinity150504_noHs@27391